MRSQRDRASKAREDTHDMQLIFAALAAVTLALPQRDNVHQGQGRGQGQGQGQGVGDTTFAVQSGARLDVNNFGGEIVVKTWNQNTVQVHSSHSSRSQVNVSASGSTVLVRTEGRRGPPSIVDLAITVPAWMGMTLSGTYTDISVDGAGGSVTAESVQGDIEVTGGTGNVSLKSVEGSVTLAKTRGRIDVNSVQGDISIEDANGDITVETVDGDITLGRIDARNVEVNTVDGDFDFSFPVDTVRTARHRFTFTLGRGGSGARLELETFSGDIKLRRPGEVDVESRRHSKDHQHNRHDNDN